MVPINYLAVILSMIVSMVLGWLWFGALFGKQWMATVGMTPEKMAAMQADPKMKSMMMKNYLLMALGALVMAFILNHFVIFLASYSGFSGISAGISAGFLAWLGFVAPVTLGGVLWEQKPWKWWLLMNGYYLIDLLLMGIILGMWM